MESWEGEFTMHKKQEQLSFFNLTEENDNLIMDSANKHISPDPLWPKNKDKRSIPIELITDFDLFLKFLSRQPVQLTKKMKYIPRKFLPAINDQLSVKSNDVTKNSEQQFYPYIHFFYALAKEGSLFNVSNITTHPHLSITDRCKAYGRLTDVEKYFFLLETFWIDIDWVALLDLRYNSIIHIFDDVFTKLTVQPHLGLQNSLLANLTRDWNYFFLYMEWFGLWVCELDMEEMENTRRKNEYIVKSISRTPFGQKIIPILLKDRHPHSWNIPFRCEYGEVNPIPGSNFPVNEGRQNTHKNQGSQRFYKAFSDLFTPGLLYNALPRNERSYIPGVYTFKVAYSPSSWCKILLGANHTMEDLHNMIIKSFQFSHDHLYSFFMDGRKWSNNSIVAPLDHSDRPLTTEVKIGAAGLQKGKQFMYLYDYGDEWVFTVTVMQVEEEKPEPPNPSIIERKGHAPVHYFHD